MRKFQCENAKRQKFQQEKMKKKQRRKRRTRGLPNPGSIVVSIVNKKRELTCRKEAGG